MKSKWFKRLAIGIPVAYAGLVILFESLLGFFQPEMGNTVVIATFDAGQQRHERVISLVEIDGVGYIAANHWPRAWFRQARENPSVEISRGEGFETFNAILLQGEEEARVAEIYDPGLVFRFLTGFPPRYFMRLEHRQE